MINDLFKKLSNFKKSIAKSKTTNINKVSLKEEAIELGKFYFESVRNEAESIVGDTEALKGFDDDWQSLIRLAYGNSKKSIYNIILKRLFKATKDLSVLSQSNVGNVFGGPTPNKSHSDLEKILIKTLESISPSAASCYKQGIQDLNSISERISYRGTALEFREALRDTLDYLAQDTDVKNESWYKQEENTSGPTMKQKVRYILSTRKINPALRKTAEKSVELIETIIGDLTRGIYTRASISAHKPTTKGEVYKIKSYLDPILFELLEIKQD